METVWLALMSGTFGALLAYGSQLLLSRRAERQLADRDRVSTVLEFTGCSSAMVMWAIYVNGHVSKAGEPMSLPAIILRQFSTVDVKDVATTFISSTTELVRLGGHLVASEGLDIEPLVNNIAATAVEIVKGYLSPKESRPKWQTLLKPFPPADLERLQDLERHRAKKCQELEIAILARCKTLKGRELASRDQSHQPKALAVRAEETQVI